MVKEVRLSRKTVRGWKRKGREARKAASVGEKVIRGLMARYTQGADSPSAPVQPVRVGFAPIQEKKV